MERVLVVFYSQRGHTRKLAEAVARALGADLEEIREPTDRSGLLGYLRSGTEALLGVSAEIARPKRDAGRYDLVVVGTPVWAASVSPPARTYLWLERERLPAVALFCTMGGTGDARAFGQMAAIAGKKPIATLAVREAEIARGAPREKVAAFAAALAGKGRKRGRARAAA